MIEIAPRFSSSGGKIPFSKEYVQSSLEFAGQSLLSMRIKNPGPCEMRGFWPSIVQDEEVELPLGVRNRAVMPIGREIDAMDEILAWIQLIPQEKAEMRRAVGLRSLISPISDKHLYPWKRIAKILSCDPRTAMAWHATGIGLIARELNTRPMLARLCVGVREFY